MLPATSCRVLHWLSSTNSCKSRVQLRPNVTSSSSIFASMALQTATSAKCNPRKQDQSKALQQHQQADSALCSLLMQVFRAKLITATESADHPQSPEGVSWRACLAQQQSHFPHDSWAPQQQQQQRLLLTAISWCNIDEWSTSWVAKDNP